MNELLKNASEALIANDAALLERLAEEAAAYGGRMRMVGGNVLMTGVGPAAEVLRQQVLAASIQLSTRRRLSGASSLQAHPWGR